MGCPQKRCPARLRELIERLLAELVGENHKHSSRDLARDDLALGNRSGVDYSLGGG